MGMAKVHLRGILCDVHDFAFIIFSVSINIMENSTVWYHKKESLWELDNYF